MQLSKLGDQTRSLLHDFEAIRNHINNLSVKTSIEGKIQKALDINARVISDNIYSFYDLICTLEDTDTNYDLESFINDGGYNV